MKYALILITVFMSLALSLPLYTDPGADDMSIYFFALFFTFVPVGVYFYLKERNKVSTSTPLCEPERFQRENPEQKQKSEALIKYLKESQVKPEIEEALFRVNHFLKELYTLLDEELLRNETEFLYDLDKDIPVEIVGDAVLYKQIFYHILSSLLASHDVQTLILSLHHLHEEDQELLAFEITLVKKPDAVSENEEKYDFEYAKTLLADIKGQFFSYPWVDKKKRFQIKIPFIVPEHTQIDYYHLPEEIQDLHILLVEKKALTSTIYRKIFQNFGISVRDVLPKDIHQALESRPYDIIFLDIDEYPTILQHQLNGVKQKHGSKIIALGQASEIQTPLSKKNRLIDRYLSKPLTPGTVHDFLFEAYQSDTEGYEADTDEEKLDTVLLKENSEIQREDFKLFGNAHVLIVEDNKINQKILENILAQSDLEVSVANHGAKALEILNHEKNIDLVLMDINMPVMDGYEATRRIRQIKKYKYLPIVVVSGLGYRNEIEKMYHIGADAHLSKPFKIEELYEVFENMLLTDKESDTSQVSKPQGYRENKSILNTTKGLFLQKNVFQFRDMLGEMIHRFGNAPEHLKTLLIKESYTELSDYLQTLLEESEDIGAEAIKELVFEMKILSEKREEALLKTYLPHFNDVWRETLRQIRSYLENSRK